MTNWVSRVLGSSFARWCGIVQPTPLIRATAAGQLFSGTVYLCGQPSALSPVLLQHWSDRSIQLLQQPPDADIQAIVFDGSALQNTAELQLLWQQLHKALPFLVKNGRLLVLSRALKDCRNAEQAATAAALSGFTRSVAKEIGRFGSTANLLTVEASALHSLLPALEFLLSSASAYITGQNLPVRAAAVPECDRHKPLGGKTALVTGAAQGIGAAIARQLAAQGAVVIGLDIPAAQAALEPLMQQLQGKSLLLDISSADSATVLADWLHQQGLQLDILVHNAGITRDKLFHRMTEQQWTQTLDVNLRAVQRIDQCLLQQQLIRPEGRVVLLSSMNGLAGQKGQTNYASSKAALVGYCQFMAGQDHHGITFNAVAPGFIETQMTAAMPLLPREIGRRLNSLLQAGQPDDVAQAVAFFARPDATGLNGAVLRVCGQCLIGA